MVRDLDALDLVSGRFGAFRISIGEGMAEMMSGGIRMALNDRDLPGHGPILLIASPHRRGNPRLRPIDGILMCAPHRSAARPAGSQLVFNTTLNRAPPLIMRS